MKLIINTNKLNATQRAKLNDLLSKLGKLSKNQKLVKKHLDIQAQKEYDAWLRKVGPLVAMGL